VLGHDLFTRLGEEKERGCGVRRAGA
jgi:hypothetical protein